MTNGIHSRNESSVGADFGLVGRLPPLFPMLGERVQYGCNKGTISIGLDFWAGLAFETAGMAWFLPWSHTFCFPQVWSGLANRGHHLQLGFDCLLVSEFVSNVSR
jgi:hypothetical protein